MIIWLSGLVRRRAGRMLPAILGVSLTIALLAVLGIFINASANTSADSCTHASIVIVQFKRCIQSIYKSLCKNIT